MSYAVIMVNVEEDELSSARIKLAAHLSVRFGCALIGVAARPPEPVPRLAGDIVGGPDIVGGGDIAEYQYEIKADDAWLEKQAKRFHTIAAPIQPNIEWRSTSDDDPLDYACTQARAADLAVIAPGRLKTDSSFTLDPAAALLKMGRPVLTVPGGVEALQAQRIVVAWKDTREARRALRDALPLLREAKEVFVIEAVDEGSESQAQKNVDDVAAYLVRHQVIVAAKCFERIQTTAGVQIIHAAQARGADLIVVGAYGHSRLGEWIFGGVTRELLKMSPICCLFSH
jgi:nucleotide-binding universal stress UspA family protein